MTLKIAVVQCFTDIIGCITDYMYSVCFLLAESEVQRKKDVSKMRSFYLKLLWNACLSNYFYNYFSGHR